MSHKFGKVTQTAYVVSDIEATLRHWTEVIGVGPWFYRDSVPIETFTYHGEPSDLEMSIALGYDGDMQFELIQQRNDAPSVYKEFIEKVGYGQQHLGFQVENLDASIEMARAHGYQIEQEGIITNSGAFAYMSTGSVGTYPLGTMIEFIPITDSRRLYWPIIQSWSVDWDGSNPVRTSI
tara:strand:- start:446 stop:982 length:537 start_codon:yes stop_codon:yes gene_type:complete